MRSSVQQESGDLGAEGLTIYVGMYKLPPPEITGGYVTNKNDKVETDAAGKEGDIKVPPFNFTVFILSLASSAQIHMGLVPDPTTNKTNQSLPLAKQTIDILGMLQEKTKGNLDENESKILEHLLYELRIQYVEKGGKGGAV